MIQVLRHFAQKHVSVFYAFRQFENGIKNDKV